MGLEEKARKLAAGPPETVDWDAERDWWIEKVDALYADVEGWLKDLVDKKLVEISRTRIRLSEENIGVYGVDTLVLTFGPAAIVLRPMGTIIIGSRGRIDLYRRGRRGDRPAMLILGGSKNDATWAIWRTRDPRDEDPLSAETFEAALEGLL